MSLYLHIIGWNSGKQDSYGEDKFANTTKNAWIVNKVCFLIHTAKHGRVLYIITAVKLIMIVGQNTCLYYLQNACRAFMQMEYILLTIETPLNWMAVRVTTMVISCQRRDLSRRSSHTLLGFSPFIAACSSSISSISALKSFLPQSFCRAGKKRSY